MSTPPPPAPKGELDGQVAVVVGAGRGIGRAIALAYADAGALVVVSARTGSEIELVAAKVRDSGGQALAVVSDASSREAAPMPIERAVADFGRIDILVNAAGGHAGDDRDPLTCTDDVFEASLRLNLHSAWWASRAAARHMVAAGGGSIINLGSGDAKRAGGRVAYTTAKHALVGLTRTLARHWGPHGVRVNCLCPGWTNTELNDWNEIGRARGVSSEAARGMARADSLQNRILEPEELTGMAILLAGRRGSGVTGQVLSVDGGYRL